jgi:CopA family copper-resistance protein
MQEAMGVYGPIIIDPAGPDPVVYDREHVVLLADWSPLHPHKIMQKLKKDSEYFDQQRTTLTSLIDGSDPMKIEDRLEWGKMRMEPTDISDITGKTYTYLINGLGPDANWTGLFRPGERARLRLINGSAMSYFNFRIPGLKMTVVQADGQNLNPVKGIDELQLGVAETYDVIVEPVEDRAYNIVAENTDSSGMARGTLAPRPGMTAPVPALRKRPLLTMKDTGMDMSNMNGPDGKPMEMDMSMRNQENAPQVSLNAGVASIAPMAADRLAERGQGTGVEPGHRVLVYTDLQSLEKNPDTRKPSRSILPQTWNAICGRSMAASSTR